MGLTSMLRVVLLVAIGATAAFGDGLMMDLGPCYSGVDKPKISADGTTVIVNHYSAPGSSSGVYGGWVWTETTGTQTSMNTLLGQATPTVNVTGVSANGTTIVGVNGSIISHATGPGRTWSLSAGVWQTALSAVTLTPRGVSADGTRLAAHSYTFGVDQVNRGWLWTASGTTEITGGSVISPQGISDDGSVIFGWGRPTSASSGYQAFRWTESGGTVFSGALGGSTNVRATASSADGSVLFGQMVDNPGDYVSFRWRSTGDVLVIPGLAVEAVTADGRFAVGTYDADPTTGVNMEAGIWDDAHGVRNLRTVLEGILPAGTLDGWELDWATDLSADGKWIVGYGTLNGEFEVFRADPVLAPEPATLGLIALGGLGLLARRRSDARPISMPAYWGRCSLPSVSRTFSRSGSRK